MCSTGMKSESSSPIIQTEPPIPTAAASSSAPPSPNWIELPQDLTANVLQRLYPEEILLSAQLVCTTWWRASKNPSMWRVIHLDIRRRSARDFGNICRCKARQFDNLCNCYSGGCPVHTRERICCCALDKFENISRCAVDRSQGQLLDLTLAGFNLDGLLNYVAERSSQLRCLKLVEYKCNDAAGSLPLTLHITKLQQLEELHLLVKPLVDPEEFETIGIACPNLKSFTYHNCFTRVPDLMEYYATAIGKTMPNLHHLRLCQYMYGNKVLEPILDGCPNLKSLDLRRCSGFDDEDSGKRCIKKDLWLYSDSISLMDWLKKCQDNYDTDVVYADDFIRVGTCCDVFDWNYTYWV